MALLGNRLKPLWRRWIGKVCCMCNVDWPVATHIKFGIREDVCWVCVNNSIWYCIFPPLSSIVNITMACLCCPGDFRHNWLIGPLGNIGSGLVKIWLVQFYNRFTTFHFHFSLPHHKIASYTASVALIWSLLWQFRVPCAHSQLLRMHGPHAPVPEGNLELPFEPEREKLPEICSWGAGSNNSSCQAG